MDEQDGFASTGPGPESRADAVPSGLPVLSAGAHPGPERGSCVMEYVSVLAGERWSDRPRCTDRALAELARLVNDDVRADARPALALLAPRLVGAVGPRSAIDVVIAAVARVGLEEAPDDPGLTRLRQRALDRLTRGADGARRGRPRRPRKVLRALCGADVVAVYYRLVRGATGSRAERDAARIRALTVAVEDVRRFGGAVEESRERPRTTGPSAPQRAR